MKTLTKSVALALSLLAATSLPAQDLGLDVGTKAPAAVVETLDGKAYDIGQHLGKSAVVIEFWATWCGNCKELEPALLAAHKKYGDKVRFLAIAVSVNQSPQRVKLHLQKHPLPFEMLYDRTGAASGAFDVFATSTIVVIDKAGTVVYSGSGGDQNIEAAIRKAL